VAIIDFFDRGWRINPDGRAYVTDTEQWSYSEARQLSCRIAHALRAAGLGPDAKVAVLSPNTPTAMISILGIWRAGLTWVPLNTANPMPDNRNLLERFDCSALLFHSSQHATVKELRGSLPAVALFVCLDEHLDDCQSLEQWTTGQPSTHPDIEYLADAVVAIMPTGGTTGPSKGVMITNRGIAAAFAHMMLLLVYRADEAIVNLAAAPITHTAGLLSMPTTARGGTVVILPRPEPTAVLEAIERHRVTELFLPPTVIYRLLESDSVLSCDHDSLRYFLYGAAPMSLDKLRRALDIFGPVMTGAYGQVEAFAAIAYLRPEEHFINGDQAPDSRLSSCGRPYPLIEVRILDEAGQQTRSDVPGEICVRGDLVMRGYYKDPEHTAATITDGWLHTGDIGYLDDTGYLHITDRKKDMIISGGFNVYPTEVEQVLWRHPAVLDCAVIGVPDEDWGEAVTAVVELNSGAEVTAVELRALCREALGGIRTPKRIQFVDSLPRSPTGKVLRRDVRDRYWKDHTRLI